MNAFEAKIKCLWWHILAKDSHICVSYIYISSSCYWNAPDLDLLSLEVVLEVWNMNRSALRVHSAVTPHILLPTESHSIEGFHIHFEECQNSSTYTPLKLTVGNQWKLDIIYVGCNLKSRTWALNKMYIRSTYLWLYCLFEHRDKLLFAGVGVFL